MGATGPIPEDLQLNTVLAFSMEHWMANPSTIFPIFEVDIG